MVETKRHGDAFDYYYSLGNERSCQKVATELSISRTSVQKWKKAFNWKERIIQRDLEINKKVEEKTNDAIVNTKADYRAMIKERLASIDVESGYLKTAYGTAKKLLEDGQLGATTIKDLTDLAKAMQGMYKEEQNLVKLDLLLMGEADGRGEGVVVNFHGIDLDKLPE